MTIYNKDTHKVEEINLYPEFNDASAESNTFYDLVEYSANAVFNTKRRLYEMDEESLAYYRPIAQSKAELVEACEKYGIDYDSAISFAVQYDYLRFDDDWDGYAHLDGYEICAHIREIERETGENIESVISR